MRTLSPFEAHQVNGGFLPLVILAAGVALAAGTGSASQGAGEQTTADDPAASTGNPSAVLPLAP